MELMNTIRDYLEQKDLDALKALLANADTFDIVEALETLHPGERTVVFRLLDKNQALSVFEAMDADLQGQLMEGFAEDEALAYLGDLPADERVRLLDELPAKVARRLLSALPPEVRETTDFLMGYDPGTAGRLMNPSFVSVRREGTAEDALQRIRRKMKDVENPYVIYVTDDTRHLEGVLSLRDLVAAPADILIEQMMDPEVVSVSTGDDQEDVANILQDRDLSAVPVLDSEGRLVGIVSIYDAMDILEEEATEDIFDKAGLLALQEEESGRSRRLLEGGLMQVLRARLPFLLITLAGGMLAGTVIAGYEESLEAVPFVAFFIPVIMDMGGNVGTQSSTIFTRALVLGHIDITRFLRTWGTEVRNGVVMGVLLGALGGMIASLWQGIPELGWAVGVSLAFTIAVATALGFLIPWILVRLGMDQAAGSDPIITTLKDITGLLIYFLSINTLLAHML